MRLPSALLALWIGMYAPAPASAQDSFYAGKIINLIVGSTPGAGMDAYGRLLARHIGRHIPGKPTIVVQNMPGASSLNSVRYLDASAPKDGTAITTFNAGLLVQAITAPNKVNAKFFEYAWLGSISSNLQVCYTWAAAGIKTWANLLRKDQVVMGDTGVGSTSYIDQKMLEKIFGVKLKQVLGYPGTAEKQLAIERGELDGDCGIWTTIPDAWLSGKKINIVVRFQDHNVSGLPEGVPYAGNFLEDPDKKALLELLNVSSEIGRPVILSGAVPAERVRVLQSAFDTTMKDPQFMADAKTVGLDVSPISGPAVSSLMKKVYGAPPSVIDLAKQILGE
jgi:tripartite-type tricarboxylate transporter receptor subunit TctC